MTLPSPTIVVVGDWDPTTSELLDILNLSVYVDNSAPKPATLPSSKHLKRIIFALLLSSLIAYIVILQHVYRVT